MKTPTTPRWQIHDQTPIVISHPTVDNKTNQTRQVSSFTKNSLLRSQSTLIVSLPTLSPKNVNETDAISDRRSRKPFKTMTTTDPIIYSQTIQEELPNVRLLYPVTATPKVLFYRNQIDGNQIMSSDRVNQNVHERPNESEAKYYSKIDGFKGDHEFSTAGTIDKENNSNTDAVLKEIVAETVEVYRESNKPPNVYTETPRETTEIPTEGTIYSNDDRDPTVGSSVLAPPRYDWNKTELTDEFQYETFSKDQVALQSNNGSNNANNEENLGTGSGLPGFRDSQFSNYSRNVNIGTLASLQFTSVSDSSAMKPATFGTFPFNNKPSAAAASGFLEGTDSHVNFQTNKTYSTSKPNIGFFDYMAARNGTGAKTPLSEISLEENVFRDRFSYLPSIGNTEINTRIHSFFEDATVPFGDELFQNEAAGKLSWECPPLNTQCQVHCVTVDKNVCEICIC